MADSCPTCGTEVCVVTGDEGTSHYEVVAEAREQKLIEALEGIRDRARSHGDLSYMRLADFALSRSKQGGQGG